MVAVFSGSLFILMTAFIFKVVQRWPFRFCNHNMPIVETMVLRGCLVDERRSCLSCFILKASTMLTFFMVEKDCSFCIKKTANRRNNGAEGLSPFQLLCWSKLLRLYSFGGKIQTEPNFKITYFSAAATNLVLNFSI